MTWLAYSHLGVAKTVQLTTQPAVALAGIPFGVQPVGRLVDGSGVLSRATGVTVTASKAGGTGTLSGTLSVQTVEGVFTFTDLRMDTVTSTVTLLFASSGLTSATSNPFNVTQPNTTIGAETGGYVTTGVDAALSRTRVCQCVPGSYAITGTDTGLNYSGGTGWLANLPANYTHVWTDYPFNDPIPVGGDTLVVPGGFWHQVFNSGYLSRVADNTGPVSPGYVLQNHNYPGMPSGGGSGGLYGLIANGTTEVYVSLMSKWDSNYEWNAISNKFFIFEPDHIIIESNHNTGQWWTVEWSNPNEFYTSNIDSSPITLGVWHNVEILLRRGPSGRIRIWVDGVLHMDRSVAIPLTVEPYEQTMNLANTWGGATGPTTRDSYRWSDHIYIATPP